VRRYTFGLAPVLRVRRREQEVARAGVLAATARASAEATALAERERAYVAGTHAQGLRSAAEFVFEQAHRAALGNVVLEQRRRLLEAEQDIQAARAVLTAATARVRALDRLDERQRAEHTARALREDELIVDDLVVSPPRGSAR
jgi:flagellar FliJ protein